MLNGYLMAQRTAMSSISSVPTSCLNVATVLYPVGGEGLKVKKQNPSYRDNYVSRKTAQIVVQLLSSV